MGYLSRHKRELPLAKARYGKVGAVQCPYFNSEVVFNAQGFHHLRYNSAGSERTKKAQLNKFFLLKFAVEIVSKSGTVQQYRQQLGAVGRKKGKSGHRDMKLMTYWAFEGILGKNEKMVRVKVVVRQVGEGTKHFWSVMSDTDFSRKSNYKMATDDIIDA